MKDEEAKVFHRFPFIAHPSVFILSIYVSGYAFCRGFVVP
jgi:hypothetical protein